jgi:hypothetical protein
MASRSIGEACCAPAAIGKANVNPEKIAQNPIPAAVRPAAAKEISLIGLKIRQILFIQDSLRVSY